VKEKELVDIARSGWGLVVGGGSLLMMTVRMVGISWWA